MSAPLDYQPLATAEDMREGPYSYVIRGADPGYVESTMARASRNVESRCKRRLAPFSGYVQTEIAEGVSPDSGGYGGMPVSMQSTLALSRAGALSGGAGGQCRDFWLDECAPLYPDLWTYTDVTVSITPPVGGGSMAAGFTGPARDTGHIQLALGTWCPPGSTVAIGYGGGYTIATPDDLIQATMMQATKLFILGIAPERRAGMSTTDLDGEITNLLIPYGAEDPKRPSSSSGGGR